MQRKNVFLPHGREKKETSPLFLDPQNSSSSGENTSAFENISDVFVSYKASNPNIKTKRFTLAC